MGVTVVSSGKRIQENSVSGNSTNSYANAVVWDTRELGEKTLILTNTDSTNAIYYQVLVTANYASGQNFSEITETLIGADDGQRIHLNNPHAKVIVQVKSAVNGSPAGYQLDYEGLPT